MLVRLSACICALFGTSLVHALSPKLKKLHEQHYVPGEPLNKEWSKAAFEEVKNYTDEETFDLAQAYEGDEGRLPEHDCIEMDTEMFLDLFYGENKTTDVWYIAFISKKRS